MTYCTIPGFEQLTKQEMFDMSAKHVLGNGKASSLGSVCAYGGIGCAAAPFLLSEMRNALDEEEATWDVLEERGKVPEHLSDFVSELQGCHDDAFVAVRDNNPVLADARFIEEYKNRMRALADKEKLLKQVLA